MQPKALRGLNISNSFQQICIASYPGNSKAGGNVGDVAIAVLLWEHFDEHDSELTGIIYIYVYDFLPTVVCVNKKWTSFW